MSEQTFRLFGSQFDFVDCTDRECGYIGGVGSGKTFAGAVRGYLYAVANPGSIGIVTAPTYPMLRDATIVEYKNVLGDVWDRCDWSAQEMKLTLPNGSEIWFRSARYPDRLRGPSIAWAHLDEAALTKKDAYDIIIGRLRQPGFDQQLWLTTTPKGFNWVYDLYRLEGFKAFLGKTRDNPHTNEEYKASMEARYSGSFAKQELEGAFVASEGLIYLEFDFASHLGDFPYNPRWPVDLTWDFGHRDPTAILVIQQDAEANIYVVDEVYRTRTLDEDIVAELRHKPYWGSLRTVVCDAADPGRIERLRRLKLPAVACAPSAKKDINSGIEKVKSVLAARPPKPVIRIHNDVEMLPMEAGQYRWAEGRSEKNVKKPFDAYNHCWDAFRYWIETKYLPTPSKPKSKKPPRRVMGFQRIGRAA